MDIAVSTIDNINETKKEWETPELKIIEKETIQGNVLPGNDGGGANSGS